MKIAFNCLSANQQCSSAQDCHSIISQVIECFEYCRTALSANTVQIFFDPNIEMRSISNVFPLSKSIHAIGSLPEGRELIRLWYVYTRNRCNALEGGSSISVKMSDSTGEFPTLLEGDIHIQCDDECNYWLSFSGPDILCSRKLSSESQDGTKEKSNHFHISHLRDLLPRYEPNQKHGPEDYIRAGGEHVSSMPFSTESAQELLFTSIEDPVSHARWAYHVRTEKIYCFKRTGGNVFHGYREDDISKIPQQILKQIRDQSGSGED